jgi:hypothetical protein
MTIRTDKDAREREEHVDFVSLRQVARLSYLDGIRARSQASTLEGDDRDDK